MNPYYSRYYTFIKPIARNKYVRSYSSLTFSLILSVIFIVFAIRPTFIAILSIQRSIDEKKQLITQIDEKTNNLTKAKASYQAIDEETISKIEGLLPDKVNVSSIVESLNTLSALNQASISGIQIQPIELTNTSSSPKDKPEPLEPVTLTFNILGAYHNVVRFLSSISSAPRLMSIDSVNINQRDSGELAVTINGKAYVLRNL